MVQDKLDLVRLRIEKACLRSKRTPDEVKVVLVTKQVDPSLIKEAYEAGIRDFGENRVQDWLGKKDELPADIKWHLIGHLQTNKTKDWIGQTELVHSVDSERLAETIEAEAAKQNVKVDCLLQVNTSGEQSKFGVAPEGLAKLVGKVSELSHLQLKGLMTIGPFTEDMSKVRLAFKKLRELFLEMKKKFPAQDWKTLSMGMSSDFEVAIEEGSTLVRIGTAVFGARKK